MTRAAPAALILAALAGCGGAAERPREPAVEPRAAFTPLTSPPRSAPPARPEGRHLTAEVLEPVGLRAIPRGRVLHRIKRQTEFGSQTILNVLARRDGWLKVAAAQLPNHRRGWIPEARARLRGTDYDIHVDRSERRAALRRDGRAVLRFPVAVGRPGNETPLGRFAVTDKLKPTDGTSPYGCCALALTGHQTRLEPGGPGGDRLAIHGTPATWSIGRAASLGCMRAPEKALHKLMRRVPLGTPVVIRA